MAICNLEETLLDPPAWHRPQASSRRYEDKCVLFTHLGPLFLQPKGLRCRQEGHVESSRPGHCHRAPGQFYGEFWGRAISWVVGWMLVSLVETCLQDTAGRTPSPAGQSCSGQTALGLVCKGPSLQPHSLCTLCGGQSGVGDPPLL